MENSIKIINYIQSRWNETNSYPHSLLNFEKFLGTKREADLGLGHKAGLVVGGWDKHSCLQ